MPVLPTVQKPEPGGLLRPALQYNMTEFFLNRGKRKRTRRKESITSQSSVISSLTHSKEEELDCFHLSQQGKETAG